MAYADRPAPATCGKDKASVPANAFRILMFSTYFPPEYSGAALQAISLARELRNRGHYVEFLTQRWPGLPAADRFEDFRVHRLEAGRGLKHKELRLWWNLTRFAWARRREFDFLHSHGAYYTHAFFGPLGRATGLKSLAKASLADNDLHGLGRGFSGRIHHRMLRRVDACIAISRDLEREFLHGGIARSRVHFMPNGVDTERFHPATAPEKRALRQRLDLPLDRPVALYIGVFDQRKNIGWLIRNWKDATAGAGKPLLFAVGPTSRVDEGGAFKRALTEFAGQQADVVRIWDQVDDVTDLYRASDLFVLPSRSEGLPNAVLEAMACGLTCVAADVSGTRELITDGETGFLFEPGDLRGLERAVTVATAAGRDGVARAARALMEEKFSIHQLASSYEALYARLLHETAGGR